MTKREHEPRPTSGEPAEVCEMRETLARFVQIARTAVDATTITQRALRDSFRPPPPQAGHRMLG